MPSNTSVTYSLITNNHAQLIYSPIANETDTGCSLTYDITVDDDSAVLVQVTGVEANSNRIPYTIDIPIMNFNKTAVITGAARYARNDSAHTWQSSSWAGGIYAPSMAVAEGTNAILSAWSEDQRNLSDEYSKIIHTTGYDHLVLHTGQDQMQANVNPLIIKSSTWRINTYRNWLEAARTWRVRFAARTPAVKPLWQNACTWVRKIHCVHTDRYFDNQAKYASLSQLVPVANMLYFLWNGDRLVLLGDQTLLGSEWMATPSPLEITYIKQYGWRMILYHPWDLIYNPTGAAARLTYLMAKGWLPSGYSFTPDYDGRPPDWYTYWSDVTGAYYSQLYVIHPAAAKFRAYLKRNYSDYCALYQADGAYLDILGSDESNKFASDKQVIEGKSYRLGEESSIAEVLQAYPNLPIMSEILNTGLIPYAWFTWEGYSTWKVQNATINHPLRTALIGSYLWTKEQDTQDQQEIDSASSALMGALPTLSQVGDYQCSDSRALWSQSRSQLFCQYELYNDLPANWDPAALAYYRSNTGNYFKFKDLGNGSYSYIEETPSGDVTRLTGP